ncbi:MAG: exopolyphosphatase [Lachnospiraceae bacterium]|nr:exopolyphosphatase [Lachnospiraceae bacterium]
MTYKMFAAIDVGSYELAMKIFEISPKKGLCEVDHIRHSIELGTDTYNTGKISNKRVEELCEVLIRFKDIMKSYQVSAYKAYGTSAIRETENSMVLCDLIKERTGITVDVVSNSEQRFLDYKAIASKGQAFEEIIKKGTIILDIGGGSSQISLFDNDTLVGTQNLRLGLLRMRERLLSMQVGRSAYHRLVQEMTDNQLQVMKRLFLSGRRIENIILVDDYLSLIIQRPQLGLENRGSLTRKECRSFVEKMRVNSDMQVAQFLGISEEKAFILYINCEMVYRIMELLDADRLWAPAVCLCDGIGYEYAEKNHLIKLDHDFERDILACADNICKRFHGNAPRAALMEKIALLIFDTMKKVHGLKSRERLLLMLSARLNDCGKYISMNSVGECCYSIIMANEIIGLSHAEREILANIVKYNRVDFEYYGAIRQQSDLDKESYLIVAKLCAILKLANGLVRSYREKIRDINARLSGRELTIWVDTPDDMTLEMGLIGPKEEFFEEVYHVKVRVRQKRTL